MPPRIDRGGVGRAAQLGVLIKNAEGLERMEKVNTLVVDETGTLTEGRPTVTQVVPACSFDAPVGRGVVGLSRATAVFIGGLDERAAGIFAIEDPVKYTTPAGHRGTTVTELVYRHQLRPVLQTGAMVMDRMFVHRDGSA